MYGICLLYACALAWGAAFIAGKILFEFCCCTDRVCEAQGAQKSCGVAPAGTGLCAGCMVAEQTAGDFLRRNTGFMLHIISIPPGNKRRFVQFHFDHNHKSSSLYGGSTAAQDMQHSSGRTQNALISPALIIQKSPPEDQLFSFNHRRSSVCSSAHNSHGTFAKQNYSFLFYHKARIE